jgi:hypothetical protein
MPRCALVFLVFCFVLAATAARAAELEGFGPIKFGMTKEEAWAAIDGKGKWEKEGKWLRYEYALHDRIGPTIIFSDLKLEVIQTFQDNSASDVVIEIKSRNYHRGYCAADMSYFVAAIQHKYGKPTLVRENVANEARVENATKSGTTSFRIFAFDDEALIRVVLETWDNEPLVGHCYLQVWYHPPVPSPIPF